MVDPISGVPSSSALAPSSRSYPEDFSVFFPFPTLVDGPLGLDGCDEFREPPPGYFDFVTFEKGDSLSKIDG